MKLFAFGLLAAQIIVLGPGFPTVYDVYPPAMLVPIEFQRAWQQVRKHDLEYADYVTSIEFAADLDYKSTVLAYVLSTNPTVIHVNPIYREFPDIAEKTYDLPRLLRHELAHVRQSIEDPAIAGVGRTLKEREADMQANQMLEDEASARHMNTVLGGGWCEECMLTTGPGCDLSPACLSAPIDQHSQPEVPAPGSDSPTAIRP